MRSIVIAAAVLFAGCSMIQEPRGVLGRLWRLEVGPDYRRPAVDTPDAFRGRIAPDDAASIADVPWWEVFGDAVLRRLVARSLAGNYDLQAAVARIEQARAQVGIAASDLHGRAKAAARSASGSAPPRAFNGRAGVDMARNDKRESGAAL